MSTLITADPAVLTVAAPDGTPATADTTTGAQLHAVVASNRATFPGAVGVIVTRVMVGAGPYFDGDTPDAAGFDYAWTGPPNASTSTEHRIEHPGGVPPLTWDEFACRGPVTRPDYGRWSDVSASLRWDAMDPSVTWDNYK